MSGGRKQPVRVAEALAAYLKRSGLADRLEETTVLEDWADLVGARIAGAATPLQVANGVLLVAVRSSAWLMELRLMEADIRARLNDGRQKGRIEKIRFVTAEGEEPGRPARPRPRRNR
jgi:predicted nucleic acid-binding Zn ribbon protein